MSKRRLAAVGLVMSVISGCESSFPVTPTPGAATSAPGSSHISDVFAFLITAESTTITFDPAQILTGEEARLAAVAAGVIEEGEELPNDFFISNPDQNTTTAELVDGVFVVLGYDSNLAIIEVTLDREAFVSVLNGADPGSYYGIVPGQTPLTLHLRGAVVTGASQVYLP